MSESMIDVMARRLASTTDSRRGVLGLGLGSILAGLAQWPDEARAACRAPKKKCGKGKQCCTGTCKKGKCATCAKGAIFLPAPDLLCWLDWGGQGSGNGQFNFPFGVAVGGNGHVYVADESNHRIQEFDAAGAFVRKWDSNGTGDGERSQPYGMAVGGNGHIYVADRFNDRIQAFDATKSVDDPGFFVRTWGTGGGGDGHFAAPIGVAVGAAGKVYVADAGNYRIQAFDATKSVDDPGFFVRAWGSRGNGPGQLNNVYGVAVGGAGQIYVADSGNDRIARVQEL